MLFGAAGGVLASAVAGRLRRSGLVPAKERSWTTLAG
jgi:hypothetical protein